MIQIACNIDAHYVVHCCTMLTSLFVNNPDEAFTIHIISSGLADRDKAPLRQLVTGKHRQTISFHDVSEEMMRGAFVREGSHISIATYYRLFMAELLPDNIDKVLYLDCDLVVDGAVGELWDTPLEGHAFACVEDQWSGKSDNYERLQYDARDTYFNAGVLLVNLRYWRDKQVARQGMDYIAGNHERLLFYDQDVLNALYHDAKVLLPQRWNVQDGFLRRKKKIRKEALPQLMEELQRPVIIHYTGSKKPWQYNCESPYRALYFKYLDMTAWSGQRPVVPRRYKIKKVVDSVLYFFNLKQHRYA